ncbi:MAG: hypothetical protein ACFCU6_04320 [Balneolaceae bacterium]
MSTTNKKSLGHSPLGYSVIGNSNFDYIPDYNALIESEAEQRISSFRSKHEQEMKSEKSQKKIVSYYIEEDVTNRLRNYADDHKSSYSAAATQAIERFVNSRGY